jgi:plasmid stabilization system protein ParE
MGKQKKTTAKNYQVSVSASAIDKINEITRYIAFTRQQPLNAIKVGDAIFEVIARIQIHPYSFKECEALTTKSKMYRQAFAYPG